MYSSINMNKKILMFGKEAIFLMVLQFMLQVTRIDSQGITVNVNCHSFRMYTVWQKYIISADVYRPDITNVTLDGRGLRRSERNIFLQGQSPNLPTKYEVTISTNTGNSVNFTFYPYEMENSNFSHNETYDGIFNQYIKFQMQFNFKLKDRPENRVPTRSFVGENAINFVEELLSELPEPTNVIFTNAGITNLRWEVVAAWKAVQKAVEERGNRQPQEVSLQTGLIASVNEVFLVKVFMPTGEPHIHFYVKVWPEVPYRADKTDCRDLGFDFNWQQEILILCVRAT